MTLTDHLCEARLRDLLTAGEEVLAVGTADEFRHATEDFSPQGRGRFLVVTSQRLLMTEYSDDAATEAIPFDDLVAWADGSQYHRYVVKLSHPPMERLERVPAHRFLWVEWGTASKPVTRETTTLRFSHGGTAAAAALRRALGNSAVAHETLALVEVPRGERMKGSFGYLQAEPEEEPES